MSYKSNSHARKQSAVLLSLVLCLAGCSSTDLPFVERKPEPERNLLTGEIGSNGKVMAVKFDDTRFAHPQQGIEAADVVIVTQVEAGLTRLMGIYSSRYPESVGPVRSARISDIDILAQFGRVGFLYSGAQSKLRPVLAAANIENLSAERNPPSIYYTDSNRREPYAMMVRIPALLSKAEDVESVKSIGWEHGKLAESAKEIVSAKIRWPNASYEAIWNDETEQFDLNFDGKPNFSVTGERLGSKMLVVQIVKIAPSEYGDKFGGITPKSTVTGEGKAFLLRNGAITEALWRRETAESGTLWTLPDGSTAYFATGQVWIFLTDSDPEVTFAPTPQKAKP